MSGKTKRILIGVVILAVLLAGCSLFQKQVKVNEEQDGSQVTLEQGEVLVITLFSSADAGYGWKVSPDFDTAVLTQQGEVEFKKPGGNMAGGTGKDIVRFEATGPGTTTITLLYMRLWESDEPPADTYTIEVQVP